MAHAIVACAVLEDELAVLRRELDPLPHLELMPQGLHNEPDRLRSELQAVIDRLEIEYPNITAIVFVYGLCSRGLVGLTSKRVQLVLPRAHDCITLLLGSKDRYAEIMADDEPTYWYSIGWNRYGNPPGEERMQRRRQEFVDAYGEENADYLMETMEHWVHDYKRAGFLDLGLVDSSAAATFTKEAADYFGWTYDLHQGDPQLLRDLLAGPWDEGRFCVVEPGHTTRLADDPTAVVCTEPCGDCSSGCHTPTPD